jgi:superfamily II DNA or RNA helicase
MWIYCFKNEFEKFLNQYPQLKSCIDYIILLETKDAYFLPRYMYYNYSNEYLKIYETHEAELTKFDYKCNIKLRPKQIPAVKKVLNLYNQQNHINGIIKAFPGFGKTIISIYIAHKIGLKTAVIVDSENTMKQWAKSIVKFTDLTNDDIGIIQGKFCVHKDKPFTLCMINTLISKFKSDFTQYFKKIDDQPFNLVIYDEVHSTSASEKYAKASLYFRTKNILGLSATPYHYGWQRILMENTIGKLIYDTKDYDSVPKYYFLYYRSGKQFKQLFKIDDPIAKRAVYNKNIIKSKQYAETVIRATKWLLNQGHVVIIIVFTIDQLNYISDELLKNNIQNTKICSKQNQFDYDNDKCLVATYKYAGKAFDFDKLSAGVLATPLSGKKSIIQMCGRILRKKPDGKQIDPIFMHLIDLDNFHLFVEDIPRTRNIIKKEFDVNVKEFRVTDQ